MARQAEERQQRKKEEPKKVKPAGGQKALLKRLNTLEREIAALEGQIRELEEAIGENATDYEALQRLFEEKAASEAALEEKIEEWGTLSEEAEGKAT